MQLWSPRFAWVARNQLSPKNELAPSSDERSSSDERAPARGERREGDSEGDEREGENVMKVVLDAGACLARDEDGLVCGFYAAECPRCSI